jgi:hypothetical protein
MKCRLLDPKYRMNPFFNVAESQHFDTSNWHSICDLTLTLKQGRKADNDAWIKLDENQCRKAFAVFMHRLDNAVYGNATRRHGKRVKILPVIEKAKNGRWHYHAAIELPAHLDAVQFEQMVCDCWSKVDWGYDRILLRDNADRGWLYYMLKPYQKSGLERYSDCIDWESLHNPIVDA